MVLQDEKRTFTLSKVTNKFLEEGITSLNEGRLVKKTVIKYLNLPVTFPFGRVCASAECRRAISPTIHHYRLAAKAATLPGGMAETN